MSATLVTMGRFVVLLAVVFLLAVVPHHRTQSQFVQDEDLTSLELNPPTSTTTSSAVSSEETSTESTSMTSTDGVPTTEFSTTTSSSSATDDGCPCALEHQCALVTSSSSSSTFPSNNGNVPHASTTCLHNRTTSRLGGCSCCHVCARQSGQSCNGLELPCDPGFKLTCVSGTCSGVAGLWVDDVTHNSSVARWRSESWVAVRYSTESESSSNWRREEIPSGNESMRLTNLHPNTTYYVSLESASSETSETVVMTTKGACDLNGTWLQEGETNANSSSCELRCSCGVGGKLDCVPRCLHRPGSITDPLCTEERDPDDPCCVIYACATKSDPQNLAPHLIITGLTASSFSVAWDDFKPSSYEKGYVLEYHVAKPDITANWTRLQANNTPMMTVNDLSPNTRYLVRVSIWDEQDSLGAASEVINATTMDGCIQGNKTFRVDETFFEGCRLKCACRPNATLDCVERCQLPLYPADNFPTAPWCTSNPDKDACCVSVQCDTSRANSDNDPSSGNPTNQCPISSVLRDPSPCESTCQSDTDCITKEEICCKTSCGATVCTNATTTIPDNSALCLNVICGKQAVCRVSDGQPRCQCVEGTHGDPNDYTRGCTPSMSLINGSGCNFKNMTYSPGENFFDGCEYRCLCNIKSEIECEPRCLGSGTILDDPTCRPVRDPDDNCCTITLCGAQPEASNVLKDPTKKDKLEFAVASDGCVYQNRTYHRSEQILEGCTKNCTCRGGGLIYCLPRCPVTSPLGQNCVSLPDPADHCCNVTICNGAVPEPDVMRDNSSAFHHHHLHNFRMNDAARQTHNDTLQSESSTTVLTNLNNMQEGIATNTTVPMSTEPTTTAAEMVAELNHADMTTVVMTTTTPSSTTEHKEVSNELESTGHALPEEVTKENENKDQRFVNSIVEEKSHFDFIEGTHNFTNIAVNNATSSAENFTNALQNDATTMSVTDSNHMTTSIPDVAHSFNSTDVSVTTGQDVFSHTTFVSNGITTDNITGVHENHNTSGNGTVAVGDVVNLFGNHNESESDIIGVLPPSDKSTISPMTFTTNTLVAGSDVTDVTATRRMDDDDLTTTPLALSDTPWYFTPFLSGNVVHSATTETIPLGGKSDILIEKKERGRKLEDKHIILNSDVTCEVDGQRIHVGAKLTIDGCQRVCHCPEGGKAICEPLTCPYHQRPEMSGCLDWEYDRTFQPTTGNCCAPATCITKVAVPAGSECSFQGRRFSHLEPIPSNMVPMCEKECRCINGNLSCEPRCSPVPPIPPPTLDCIAGVEVAFINGDQCCSEWRCKSFAGGPQEEQGDSTFVEFLNPSKKSKKPPQETKNPFLVTVSQEEQGDSFLRENGQIIPTTMFEVPQEEQGDSFSVNGHSPTLMFGDENPSIFNTNLSPMPLNPSENPSVVDSHLSSMPMIPNPEDLKCETENGTWSVGEQWEAEPNCQTRRCACLLHDNGTTFIECTRGCSNITKYLQPTDKCPKPVQITPDDPCYCPYVVCPKPDPGSNVQNMTAEALNATSVLVSLSIPKIYVGLFGLVELLYTADATRTNTSVWDKEVFSLRNDFFSEDHLEHVVHGLQPDTVYYIKANVQLRDNSNTATSPIINVRTKPLPSVSTTTKQPHISVDFDVKAESFNPTSLSVSWRPLDHMEKKVIDGLHLKSRVQGEETWSASPLLHRDVTSYVLRDLKPNTPYELELGVVVAEGDTTEVHVAGSTVFYTSPKHDDFAFNISLAYDKVLVNSVELHWSGVPFPMHKYVNAYVIAYKTDKMGEPLTVLKPPKVEQVTIEDLKPGNRYQIWMDAYLSNGDIRKSNTLEVITKPGVAAEQAEKAQLGSSPQEGSSVAEANSSNSYYEALVAVAVVAAICVLGFITLLVLLLRRQAHSTAPITAHKSQSAYDNPTYKPSYDGEIENGKPLTAT